MQERVRVESVYVPMNDNPKYKAIETIHSGFRFRSRLEARWAIFFETLGIEYRYEPEGFELEDGIRYLPDFYLPSLGTWIEIKPDVPTKAEREKAIQLCLATGEHAVILAGDVWHDLDGYSFCKDIDKMCDHSKIAIEQKNAHVRWLCKHECIVYCPDGTIAGVDFERDYTWSLCSWVECLACSRITINSFSRLTCICGRYDCFNGTTEALVSAYTAARQARF